MHVSEERSISSGQRYMWEAMPMRYKRAQKKSEQHSILYSAKNGFSDNKCIMPVTHEGADRGSSIYFNNYRQFLRTPKFSRDGARTAYTQMKKFRQKSLKPSWRGWLTTGVG